MNRETQDELSAAEAAMHEASATVEQVTPTSVHVWCVMYKLSGIQSAWIDNQTLNSKITEILYFLTTFLSSCCTFSMHDHFTMLHRARCLYNQPWCSHGRLHWRWLNSWKALITPDPRPPSLVKEALVRVSCHICIILCVLILCSSIFVRTFRLGQCEGLSILLSLF